MEADVLLYVSCFQSCGKGVFKSVHGENNSHNYHTKLAIPTLVPSNIITSHSGTGDQIKGIKHLFDTQTIGNASSEKAIRATGFQGNKETTVKISNASLRDYMKVLELYIYIYIRSCNVASMSKAIAVSINIEDILRKDCLKNANSFYKFYHRDILYRADEADFQKL